MACEAPDDRSASATVPSRPSASRQRLGGGHRDRGRAHAATTNHGDQATGPTRLGAERRGLDLVGVLDRCCRNGERVGEVVAPKRVGKNGGCTQFQPVAVNPWVIDHQGGGTDVPRRCDQVPVGSDRGAIDQ
jgi:hypothetical protein